MCGDQRVIDVSDLGAERHGPVSRGPDGKPWPNLRESRGSLKDSDREIAAEKTNRKSEATYPTTNNGDGEIFVG